MLFRSFRNALLPVLGDGERAEAGDGYRGEPRYAKHPKPAGSHPPMKEMQAEVRSRHEAINKRFKQWGCLKNMLRGNMLEHHKHFRFCCFITQLCIENGEPLFSVDYEDPDYDNLYFDDRHLGDDDDDDDEFEVAPN